MPARQDESATIYNASFTEQDADKLLDQSFELAGFFGARMVRIFTFWRVQDPNKAYPYVRDRMAKAAEKAAKAKIVLNVENEHSCNVARAGNWPPAQGNQFPPTSAASWDPGNATMLGEVPYPDGYLAVKGLFPHMHIKDSAGTPPPANWNGLPWAAASSISKASSRRSTAIDTKGPCR